MPGQSVRWMVIWKAWYSNDRSCRSIVQIPRRVIYVYSTSNIKQLVAVPRGVHFTWPVSQMSFREIVNLQIVCGRSGPLFTKQKHVLPPNLVKPRSCKIGWFNGRHWKSLHPNLAVSRLHGICGKTSVRLVTRGPAVHFFRNYMTYLHHWHKLHHKIVHIVCTREIEMLWKLICEVRPG